MKRLLKLLPAIIVGILISACSQDKKESNTRSTSDRSTSLEYTRQISFISAEGDTVTTIKAAVADEEKERNEGLMNVSDLPADGGMFFIFEDEEPRSFWMANTPLSLDIMFINSDFEIVRIHQRTEPYSEKNLSSDIPSKYVVETNGGFSITHDIQEGMKIAVSDLE